MRMAGFKHHSKGAALITVLLLIVFLATLSLARLYFAQQDYAVAHWERLRTEAYYLALSGINYYISHPSRTMTLSGAIISQQIPPGKTVYPVPPDDSKHFFELSVVGMHRIRSRGFILDFSNRVIAERTLELPGTSIRSVYEVK